MEKPNVIIAKDLASAAEVAKKLGLSNLSYDFLPVMSCYTHLKSAYPTVGRTFFIPKMGSISVATHGRTCQHQVQSSTDLLDIKPNSGVTLYEL